MSDATEHTAMLGEDIAALKRDVATLMEHLKSTASAARAGAAEQVSAEAERLYRNAVEEGKRHVATLAHQVETQPVTSVLVAFGVGLLLGRLLSR